MKSKRRLFSAILGIIVIFMVTTNCVVIRRIFPSRSNPTSIPQSTNPPTSVSENDVREPPTKEPAPDRPSVMELITVPNAVSQGAVCNDGTPAVYYFRPGVGSGRDLWIIHLQGGGLCTGQETCAVREKEQPNFMTSKGFPKRRQGDGILSIESDDTSDFIRANHVYVHYCSSDLWSGDRGASPGTDGRHFRGARIFRGVIEALKDPSITPTPNLAQAERVLFSGSSAGGVGVLVHLDWLARELPGADVSGATDAGWILDVMPFNQDVDAPASQAQRGYDYWNATVDASCATRFVGREGLCFLGEYAFQEIKQPLFIQIAQFDRVQLGGLGLTLPLNDEERAYANEFGRAVRSSLVPVEAAFSPRNAEHGILMKPDIWTYEIDGTTMREALINWFFGWHGPVKLIER
ncbi:MAG: hypothetical protein GTO18_13100 [Anaerolineales bacterium]|nr:hypothetical protein [Anaerolineales bacterium]